MWDINLNLSLNVFSGDQSQGAASPVPLKKDVENMEKGKDCSFEWQKLYVNIPMLAQSF